MTTRATTRATTRSTTRGINAAIGSVVPIVWTPASLSTLRQWLADNYYSSPVGGLQVIESLETHGTVRAPEPGAYWNLDGVNDYGTLGGSNRLTSGGQTAFTITATLIPDSITGNLAICSEWATGSIFVLHQSNAKLQLLVYYGESPTITSTSTTDSDVLAVGVPVKIAVTYNAGVVVFYVNGVVVANTQTGGAATALRSVAGRFNVGALDAGTWCYDGKICSLRMYSTVKTLAEIEAIRDCDGTAIDKTNALVIYPCSERAGTTGYNIVANANHLTLSGPITEATFHATDTSITNNVNNVLGYRLSGGVRIPAIDSTTAADGNALTYTGLSPYPATIETPCITLDGTNDYINLGDISTSPTTISIVLKLASDDQEIMTLQNSTATAVTVVAGVLTFGGSLTVSAISVDGSVVSAAAAGALLNDNEWHTLSITLTAISCSALRIGTDGSGFGSISVCELELTASGATKTFPFQEGPGTAVDNVTVYWYNTDGTYGSVASALVGVTVAAAWANLCPGYVRDHAFDHGGRLGVLGEFVPLVPGTALCADGNAATITAGNIAGNPYSRVDFDPFDAAELGALAVPSEFDSLPCVTGNGTNNCINLGSGDEYSITSGGGVDLPFEIEFDVYPTNGRGTVFVRDDGSFNLIGYSGGFYDGIFYVGLRSSSPGNYIGRATPVLALNTWHHLKIIYDGSKTNGGIQILNNGIRIDSADYSSGTYAGVPVASNNFELMKLSALTTNWLTGQMANFKFTKNNGTKYFPLTDGSGADVVYYTDGVATILSNAIQGTLTNVWANKTDGQVDHEFPEAVRAIVPRDTKFTDGATKTITTSEAATGDYLTNILEYIG